MIASVILSDEVQDNKNELREKNVRTQEESFALLQQMLLQAVIFQQNRQANEAKRIYQLILQDAPTQPNANHNLGVIELEENNFDVCLIYLKRALESAPDEPQYWISYIEALLQAGQFDDADIVLAHGIEAGLQGDEVDSIKFKLANKHLFFKALNLPQEVASTSSISNADESAVSQNLNVNDHGSVKKSSNLKSNKKKKLTIAEMNKLTNLFNQGQFEECEQLAVKMTQRFPKNGIGWKVLGAIYQQQGLIEETFKTLEVAAELLPNDSEVHYNLGNCLYDQNKLSEAASRYQKAIKIDLGFSKAHYNLGSVLKDQGFTAEAVTSYKKALKLDPNNALMYFSLAQTYHEQCLFSEALNCYQQGLKLQPDFAPAYLNMGVIFKAMGQMHEVEECFRKAIDLKPDYAEAYNNLSVYFLEKGNISEAEVFSRRSIEIKPDYADAYNNLGLIMSGMSQFDEAEAAYLKALEYNPSGVQALSNFSVTLKSHGQIARAESCLRKGIEINPDYVNLYTNLVTVLLDQGRIQEAIDISLHVLEIKPGCFKSRSNLLFAMNYSANQSADECLEQAIKFGKMVSEKVDVPFTSWTSDPDAKRLRVGMISGDFCQHAVAYFLENLVSHIDPSSIELIAYKTDGRDDEVTSRLKPHFSGWRSLVGIDDKNAAQLIHSDGLHILIDLSGHTAGNRLPVLAWKPAPVQVSWLGYFATTGMNTIDYFIADKTGVPKANVSHFVEKIKYLPDTRLCFTVPEVAIEVSTMPALTNGFITFGCFQNMAKVGDDVLDIWSEIMTALPNARLRWQCKSLGDTSIADDVMQRLIKCGIRQDRVTLLGSISRNAYLTAHNEVDMILDTFPFTGGTTTCEALWMGVPTLTLNGDTLIARQGASILSAAGLHDFIAESKEDFVSKALLIVGDLDKLAKLRAALRKQVVESPLFDAISFAKNMEILLWGMWKDIRHVYGKKFNTILKNSKEATYQDSGEDKNQSDKLNVKIVSATRFSERDFWEKSALGLSLQRHLKQDVRISANILFENTRGLSAIFNDSIDQAGEDDVLVFIHDDVWIDESNFVDTVLTGLENFDVIGVAGNVRRLPNQPAWAFIDQQFTWDDKANLSGRISHSRNAFGKVEDYGASPAECELLDGVFLAAKKSSLKQDYVRFDTKFNFHFYDLDFCRSARKSGLRLGTWPIMLTHQSAGAFGGEHWKSGYQCYLNKWEAPLTKESMTNSYDQTSQAQQLFQAMNDVFQIALTHQNSGQIEQAKILYLEILDIQPTHAEANYNLGLIETELNGAISALPRLELAVQTKPDNEQFWISYINTLMQSGAADSAVDALELGKRYGLKSETAQKMAARFVVEIESMMASHQNVDFGLESRSICPICNKSNAGFSALPASHQENALKHGYAYFGQCEMTALKTYSCINCGASDRERLYSYWIGLQLELKILTDKSKVIHFAPEHALSSKLRTLNFGCYHTADLMMDGCDFKVDMMNMPFKDESYDFFICSHVLEHVESDDSAIAELYRIMRKGGYGILMAPIVVGLDNTLEDASVKDESSRWKFYGQNDHVRLYAHNDFVKKIQSNGFHVEELGERYFGEGVFQFLGLKKTSVLYVVKKC